MKNILMMAVFAGCAARATVRGNETDYGGAKVRTRQNGPASMAAREILSPAQVAEPGPKRLYQGEPSLGLLYPVPPSYVGYTERPPPGWGEAGNDGRSVRFTNDWNPYNRYYLRVFLDGEELVFTDGVGVFQSFVQGMRRPASLLRPFGQAMHIVDVGEHHLLIERYIGPEPMQYKDTCEERVDFDGNLGLGGEWHFWGGVCHRSAPSE